MAKKKENVTEEIKVQESTVKAPVKKAAAKKVKESEAKTQSEADIENEEALKAFNILRNIDYEFFRDLKNFTRGVLFAKGIIENE